MNDSDAPVVDGTTLLNEVLNMDIKRKMRYSEYVFQKPQKQKKENDFKCNLRFIHLCFQKTF